MQIDAAIELKSRAERVGLTEFMDVDIEQMVEHLKERDDDGMTSLHRAARTIPDAEIIRCMIELESDVNAKDNVGMPPLHWAAACNPNVEVAKCLVENGANIRTENDKGVTPLDLSIRFAKSNEVGLYFLDMMMGCKGVEITDPIMLAKIKRDIFGK